MIAPPLLISFQSLDDYLKALSSEMEKEHGDALRLLYQSKLPPVVSIRCLATLVGYSPRFMSSLIARPEKNYRNFSIKKGSKTRHIQAPKVAIKILQKWMAFHLGEAVEFKEYVSGFVKGKSAIDGARIHCNAKWVYSVDIENFFLSTPTGQVERALIKLGYSESGAKIIAKLSSYGGVLAQGAPTSPFLSNLVFVDADQQLNQLAIKYGIRYSRYADDIVFSGVDSFPEALKDEVKGVIQGFGWRISERKEYFAELPARLKVLGLLVHGEQPRLTKGYRNKIRAYRHLMSAGKVVDGAEVAKLNGHISYARFIEGKST